MIVLTSDESSHLGLQTATAPAATYTPHVRGYGVIVNVSTLAQDVANVVIAQAAARASHAALNDAKTLFGKTNAGHAVSREAVDAAEHQAGADAAQVELAIREEVATFGQHTPWIGSERDSEILAKLTSGRAVLVEATFPLDVSLATTPKTLAVTRLNTKAGDTGWAATDTWDAPADPTIPGRSFFAIVEGSDLAQGEHVLILAPTGIPEHGVQISSDSIVLSEDKAWCYVLTPSNTYLRLQVDLSRSLDDGYFVDKGISPGQAVIIKGAGLLLARELGLAASDED